MIKLLVLIAIIAGLASARKSRPAHSKQGFGLVGKAREVVQSDVLKIATYNIQTGKSLDGKRNLLASTQVLSQADVVGVQEVYAPKLLNFFGVGLSQTQTMMQAGGFQALFAATRRRWLREHRGNALLSRHPVSDWRVEMLPDQSNKSFRNMTIATLLWQDREVTLINTHLHTRHGRDEQLKVVLREFAKYPCAVLMGDFNTTAKNDVLHQALKDVEISDAIALSGADDHADRIDWILSKGFQVAGGKIVEKGVSDHPYYEVHLQFLD